MKRKIFFLVTGVLLLNFILKAGFYSASKTDYILLILALLLLLFKNKMPK